MNFCSRFWGQLERIFVSVWTLLPWKFDDAGSWVRCWSFVVTNVSVVTRKPRLCMFSVCYSFRTLLIQSTTFTSRCTRHDYKLYVSFKNSCMFRHQSAIITKSQTKRSTGTNIYLRSTVGYATTNECYNERFLSVKSGCYKEREGTLSADVACAWAWRVGPSRFD